jgi:hypothetical protein
MKIMSFPTLLVLSTLNASGYAQKLTSERTNAFALSKLDYVDSCIETYAETEKTCDCTFEYMRNNYKPNFYQDDAFTNEKHQQRQKLLDKMTESLRICNAIERDEFAYPRTFE